MFSRLSDDYGFGDPALVCIFGGFVLFVLWISLKVHDVLFRNACVDKRYFQLHSDMSEILLLSDISKFVFLYVPYKLSRDGRKPEFIQELPEHLKTAGRYGVLYAISSISNMLGKSWVIVCSSRKPVNRRLIKRFVLVSLSTIFLAIVLFAVDDRKVSHKKNSLLLIEIAKMCVYVVDILRGRMLDEDGMSRVHATSNILVYIVGMIIAMRFRWYNSLLENVVGIIDLFLIFQNVKKDQLKPFNIGDYTIPVSQDIPEGDHLCPYCELPVKEDAVAVICAHRHVYHRACVDVIQTRCHYIRCNPRCDACDANLLEFSVAHMLREKQLKRNTREMGLTWVGPVQKKMIATLMDDTTKDMLAPHTASWVYLAPMIERLCNCRNNLATEKSVVIVVPTMDEATEVHDCAMKLLRDIPNVRCSICTGVYNSSTIVVGTPEKILEARPRVDEVPLLLLVTVIIDKVDKMIEKDLREVTSRSEIYQTVVLYDQPDVDNMGTCFLKDGFVVADPAVLA